MKKQILSFEEYQEDVAAAIMRSSVVFSQKRQFDDHSHIAKGLQSYNTRYLDEQIKTVLRSIIAGKNHAKILELGPGAGVAVSQMSDIGKEKVTIDTVALTEIAPSWKLSATYDELVELYLKNLSDPYLDSGFEKYDSITIKEAIRLHNICPQDIFDVCAEPFIRQQHIGKFEYSNLDEKYDFIHDSYGAFYYSILHFNATNTLKMFKKSLDLLSNDGVLCVGFFRESSLDLLKSMELPKGYEFIFYKRIDPEKLGCDSSELRFAGFIVPRDLVSKSDLYFSADSKLLEPNSLEDLTELTYANKMGCFVQQ